METLAMNWTFLSNETPPKTGKYNVRLFDKTIAINVLHYDKYYNIWKDHSGWVIPNSAISEWKKIV